MNERKDGITEETTSPAEEQSNAPFYGSAGEAMARYTHCEICGANLHFSHVTDFIRNLTQETARCPECGLKARKIVHRLQ